MTEWYNQKGTGSWLEPWSPESLSMTPQLLSWHAGFQEGRSVRFTFWSHDLACVWKRKRGKEGHRDASSSIFSLICSLQVSERRLGRRWVSSSVQRSQVWFLRKLVDFFSFLSRRMWDFVCDLTVTPTGYSKQNKLMTSFTDPRLKERLQGATFKWCPFVSFLIITK